MEIWLDTTNLESIALAKRLGILFGVTTNPSLVTRSGKNFEDVIHAVLDAQAGPVTAQVIARDVDGMLAQAKVLQKMSKRIVIKVPVTTTGLEVISQLSQRNIATMATVVFNPNQVLLAAQAGATYVAPYLGRIEKAGRDSLSVLQEMQDIIDQQRYQTKIIAASIKDPATVTACARMGIPAITITDDIFNALLQEPLTEAGIKSFEKDWKTNGKIFLHVS